AGCINLTGVATINGTYDILAIVESYLAGATTPAGTEYVDYYSITVADSCIVGIVENGQPGFKGLQNTPNPFVDETEIQFTLTEIGSIKFAVYDLLGNVVYSEDLVGKTGLNKVDFSAKGIAPGIYMYHVKKGLSTATGRMVIAR
ncbi:MAG TPA: T9SS type A sorting domain-containing protein, partial [Flavobacteriales bacterium]|nr:T9SS type A sorting domain-containing protein [Flavobacteriales bacterium]